MTELQGAGQIEAGESNIEHLLLEEGAVTEEQLQRARRIAGRMQTPRPVGEVLVELGQLARGEHERIMRLHQSTLPLVGILLEEGAIDAAGVEEYDKLRAKHPGRSERSLLVDSKLVSEELFLQALSVKEDIPYVDPEISLIDPDLLARTSIPYLRRIKVVPLRIIDSSLHAVVADPQDRTLIQELQGIFGVDVVLSCAPQEKILEILDTLDRMRESATDGSVVDLEYTEEAGPDALGGEDAVRIVDSLFYRAILLKASDLHIEPLESKVHVRVRVDGVMRKLTDLPIEFAPRIASRIKVLAGADIAERRQHQDGRIQVRIEGREVDIRVSSYVSMFGETLVMRLLDRDRGLLPMEALGFQPKVQSLLMDVVLRASSGLVLVTGPTGSGKTTTLYSFVDYVKDETKKVITCEDPVEYVLNGITQCCVNEKTGPTFADSLRAIVRQDPDIIVVGEIRNNVSAELAVESALTGHKVFSTFHTEDSVGAVLRFLEMGIEPFLAASTLSCIVAQRLIRRCCPHCRQPDQASAKDLRFLAMSREEIRSIPIVKGSGCAKCQGSGFAGRIGVHELLWPDDEFRDAIMRRAATTELRALARQLPGFLTLQEDGLLKVVEGESTLGEIVENVPRDAHPRRMEELKEIASKRRMA